MNGNIPKIDHGWNGNITVEIKKWRVLKNLDLYIRWNYMYVINGSEEYINANDRKGKTCYPTWTYNEQCFEKKLLKPSVEDVLVEYKPFHNSGLKEMEWTEWNGLGIKWNGMDGKWMEWNGRNGTNTEMKESGSWMTEWNWIWLMNVKRGILTEITYPCWGLHHPPWYD